MLTIKRAGFLYNLVRKQAQSLSHCDEFYFRLVYIINHLRKLHRGVTILFSAVVNFMKNKYQPCFAYNCIVNPLLNYAYWGG